MKFIGDRRFSELVGRKTYWIKFEKERKERKQTVNITKIFEDIFSKMEQKNGVSK